MDLQVPLHWNKNEGVYLNPSDYDGNPTFEFEIVYMNMGSSTAQFSLLVGSTVITTVDAPVTGNSVYGRVRVPFTPLTGENYYTITDSATISILARIIVTQKSATKTRIRHRLNGVKSLTSPYLYTTSSSYTYAGSTNRAYTARIKLNPSKYSEIDNLLFEIFLRTNGTGTAYACLYDVTAGAMVTGSELSTTSSTATRLTASINPSNLVDNHVYTVYYKNVGGGTTYVSTSDIVYSLKNLTKACVSWKLYNSDNYNGSNPLNPRLDSSGLMLYNTGAYSEIKKAYNANTGCWSNSTVTTFYVVNCQTQDVVTHILPTDTNLLLGGHIVNSATVQYYETDILASLVNGNRYASGFKGGNGANWHLGHMLLMLEIEAPPVLSFKEWGIVKNKFYPIN